MERVENIENIDRGEQAGRIFDVMEKIDYGWIDKNGVKHEHLTGFSENYVLQRPEQVMANGVGVCWDQVELERYLFEQQNIKCETYFLVHYDGKHNPSHTFLTFEDNGKYIWFEHSYGRRKGIYWYESMGELLEDLKEKYLNDHRGNITADNLRLFKYDRPELGISSSDFYQHCENGKIIDF